jgi:hypothetical protein
LLRILDVYPPPAGLPKFYLFFFKTQSILSASHKSRKVYLSSPHNQIRASFYLRAFVYPAPFFIQSSIRCGDDFSTKSISVVVSLKRASFYLRVLTIESKFFQIHTKIFKIYGKKIKILGKK